MQENKFLSFFYFWVSVWWRKINTCTHISRSSWCIQWRHVSNENKFPDLTSSTEHSIEWLISLIISFKTISTHTHFHVDLYLLCLRKYHTKKKLVWVGLVSSKKYIKKNIKRSATSGDAFFSLVFLCLLLNFIPFASAEI